MYNIAIKNITDELTRRATRADKQSIAIESRFNSIKEDGGTITEHGGWDKGYYDGLAMGLYTACDLIEEKWEKVKKY